jgi:tripartite ATP-independent transporter DctM subunit
MTPTMTGFVGIGVLLIILFSRMPIAFGMGLTGFLGFAYLVGVGPALGLLKTVPYSTFASHSLSVIPLFILMGAFAFSAGLSKDLYEAAYKVFGNLRGGLAMATVGACACFAAISGSSMATAATMGTVSLPEMKKYNYDPALATGSVAAGGSMGILIPPSVILIIYGIITEQSIGKLFLAGFIPGVMEAVFYMIVIAVITRFKPEMGPRGPRTTFSEKLRALAKTWEVLTLFIVVIGGIYLGIFTPTEAAGIGAFGAFIFAVIKKRMTWAAFKESLSSSIKTSVMVFAIILGAMLLGYFLSVTRIPFDLAGYIGDLHINRYMILVLILLTFIVLGCVIDTMAIILLTVPIFFPLIVQLGFDPIWFGILVVRVTEIGLLTPPVGLNVFVIKGVAPDVPIGTIFRGIVPFLIADFIHVALLIAFPQITLFLPNMMG